MYFDYSIYASNHYLFVRFRAGLDTLDVLKNIQTYPNNFEECLVHSDTKLTAIFRNDLFRPNTSEDGSNKKSDEVRTMGYWRDYLQDAEGDFY